MSLGIRHRALGPASTGILLLLALGSACDSKPPAPESSPPTPTMGQAARLDTPTLFEEVAMVGTNPCSTAEYDYGVIDNCYNVENPQRPSLLREVSSAWRPYRQTYSDPLRLRPSSLTGVMQPFPPYDYDKSPHLPKRPEYNDAATAVQVLPFHRGTNDGRLFVRGGCAGCAEGTTLYTFRPELLGQDFRYDFSKNGFHFAQNDIGAQLHPFIYYNPLDSTLIAKNNGHFPDALQSTLCEDSVSVFQPGAHGRNPVACTARYDEGSPPLPGDCYEVSLVYGLHDHDHHRWELRSVDLTVFVRDPKTRMAGDPETSSANGWRIWVYPRSPEGEVKSLPTWDLPPFEPFNVQDTPWTDMAANSAYALPGAPDTIDWELLLTTNPRFQCYLEAPHWPAPTPIYRRNTLPSAPKWCQFFDRQSRQSMPQVEDDEDAIIGNGATWDGLQGSEPGRKNLAMFEPATSGDGRLLILNMRGLFYSVGNDICRASSWRHFKPISMMPIDPDVNTRYELAKSQTVNGGTRPFRDTLGNSIPYGVLNQWAYPWLDRDGKNLIFAAKSNNQDGYYARRVLREDLLSTNVEEDVTPGAPGDDARSTFNPDRGNGQAISVLGAWTRGKAIILDNGLNLTDLAGNHQDRWQRTYDLRLYAGDDLSLTPRGSTSIFSFENQLNHFDALRPTLPFDVVWNVQSNTQRNAEVAFDDYLHQGAFVIAHMNAAMRMDESPYTGDRAKTFLQDGFVPFNAWANVGGGELADFRFQRNPLAQNAATASPWAGTSDVQPPATVRLRGGARIEPVALGGVSGKGVWLDGLNDFMDMGYRVQASQRDWLFGLWLDSRHQNPHIRVPVLRSLPLTLFYFSDESWVGLVQVTRFDGASWSDGHELQLHNGRTQVTQTVDLGSLVEVGRYFHFGMKLYTEAGERKLAVYINGTWHSTLTVAPTDVGFDPMYDSMNGWTWMDVSDPGPSIAPDQLRRPFKGWVDELRIYALSPGDAQRPWTEEFICNQALGTMVDVSWSPWDTWSFQLGNLRLRASQYPGSRYVLCEQMALRSYSEPLDYPPQYGEGLCIDRVHKNPLADPSLSGRCLRAGLLSLPTLLSTQPRPDSKPNAFCLSCHTGTATLPGLQMNALAAGTGPRFEDSRRQPMNVPAVMGGVVPPWLTQGTDLPDGTRTLDHYFDHYPAP